jgi:DNA-binding winged helix-turn-helix (wHTH) protein/tetratricopeptide (TPR) repeat protein
MTTVATKTEKNLYEFDGFRVDPVRRLLLRDGEVVPLTPKAFSILMVLIENRGEVVEKEELIQRVWPDTFVTEANLTQNISSLRKALGERANDRRFVVTVPGRGYSFVAEILEISRQATGEIPIPVLTPASPSPAAPEAQADPVRPATGEIPVLGAEAAFREPTQPIPVAPRGRRRLIAAVIGLAALLAVAIGVSVYLYMNKGRGRESVEGPAADGAGAEGGPVAERPAIAVLSFRNLSKQPDKNWLGPALAEMLGTELAAGSRARIVSGENTARAWKSISVPYTDSLSEEAFKRLHSMTGADLVVLGAYLSLGTQGGGKIRLDLRVVQLPQGEALASAAEVGTEAELFELVAKSGAKLRRVLGWADLSPEQVQVARALRPSNAEAARPYTEGLARLRAFDFQDARTLLEEAAAADPGSAVIHSALSQAWTGLGYDAKGAEEAEKAVQLSGALSKEGQLAIKGRYHESKREWTEAGEIYRSLWTFFPDDLEYGLRLVNAESVAGRTHEAMATIAALRKLPPPEGEDPRIDLAEAANAKRMSDAVTALEVAAVAEAKGRRFGESLIIAQALSLRGDALLQSGEIGQARAAFQQARDLFDKAGDQTQVALMLTRSAITLHEQSALQEARKTLEDSLATLSRTGSIAGRALQLGNLALVFRDLGDLVRAQELMEQALDLYVQSGDRVLETRTSALLATILLARGDIARAQELVEKALGMARESGTRLDEARSLDILAQVLARQGQYAEARRLHEQAWGLARPTGDFNRAATMLAGSAEALVHLGDLKTARERFLKALESKRKVGDRLGTARILGALARLAYRVGDLPSARRYSQEHLQLARSAGARVLEAEALRDLGLWSFIAGDLPGAQRRLEESMARLEGTGADLDINSGRLVLAALALSQERVPEAVRTSLEVADWYGGRGIRSHQARALSLAGQALVAQGKIKEARDAAGLSRSLAERSEDQEVQILATMSAARVEAASDRVRGAVGHLQWVIDETAKFGLTTDNLLARFYLGTIQLKAGDPAGRDLLLAVRQEAAGLGMNLITRGAEEVLKAPKAPLG